MRKELHGQLPEPQGATCPALRDQAEAACVDGARDLILSLVGMTHGTPGSGPEMEDSEELGSRPAEADLLWLIDSTISHASVTNRNDVDDSVGAIDMVDNSPNTSANVPEVLAGAELLTSPGALEFHIAPWTVAGARTKILYG